MSITVYSEIPFPAHLPVACVVQAAKFVAHALSFLSVKLTECGLPNWLEICRRNHLVVQLELEILGIAIVQKSNHLQEDLRTELCAQVVQLCAIH